MNPQSRGNLFLELLAWLFGRTEKRERIDKYAVKHIVLPAEANCAAHRRAEARRKKRAAWTKFCVSGEPSGWPRRSTPRPRKERRDSWRRGSTPDRLELFA